jgi:hypothetical protein
MAVNGDRKSTGSNFGCTFQLSAFLFPHFPRAPIPFTLQSVQHPHKLKLEHQPMMSLLTELENLLIRISKNMPARRAFKNFAGLSVLGVSAFIPIFPSPGN